MSDPRSDSAKTPASSAPPVPVPDFSRIVKQRRTPLVLILSAAVALVAATVLIFLAQGGS